MGIAKVNAEFESNPLKKVKKFTQKSYRRKTLAHSDKRKKTQFFCNFSLITFFGYPYCFFEDIFYIILSLFTNINCKRGRNGFKKWKNFSYNCVLKIKFAPVNGLGEPSCWNGCTLLYSILRHVKKDRKRSTFLFKLGPYWLHCCWGGSMD